MEQVEHKLRNGKMIISVMTGLDSDQKIVLKTFNNIKLTQLNNGVKSVVRGLSSFLWKLMLFECQTHSFAKLVRMKKSLLRLSLISRCFLGTGK